MHHFAGFGRLDYNINLHTFTFLHQIKVNSRNCKQRRYWRMRGIHATVAQHNVVFAIVHSFFHGKTKLLDG